VRVPFRVGNTDINVRVQTEQPVYKPGEKIIVDFSGLPGNSLDWISIAKAGSPDGDYLVWNFFTEGKQSGTMTFNGLPEGSYESRGLFNNENVVRARYPFVMSSQTVSGACQKHCKSQLSVFYAVMGGLG